MSDTSEPTINDSSSLAEVRAWGQRNEERAQANAQAAGRVPQLERENALLRAGGDPDSRIGRLLLSDNDVDWTDREAVTAAWTEVNPAPAAAGAPPPPEQAPVEPPDQEAIDRQARRDQLASGATVPGQEPTAHPWDEALALNLEARRRQQTPERAGALALDHVLEAAVNGDERVIYHPEVPYSEQWEPR